MLSARGIESVLVEADRLVSGRGPDQDAKVDAKQAATNHLLARPISN